ncbi:MAG TPA: hypothetical protein VNR37_03650, partial [Microbacteriaceae bacterium]|nr:hypothetical protein [Microbacteriaceae bacterium]
MVAIAKMKGHRNVHSSRALGANTSRRNKRAVGALMVAGAALVLSGCAVAVPSGSPVLLPEGRSLSSAGNDLYDCITEKGWDVTLRWDGGVEASTETIPQEQYNLY